MSSENFVFEEGEDQTFQEIPVKIRGINYVLVEADAGTVSEYKGYQSKQMKISGGKVVGIGNTEESGHYLLGMCLYRLADQGPQKGQREPKPVGINFVKTLKNTTVKPLVEKIKDISGIRAEEEEVSKEIDDNKGKDHTDQIQDSDTETEN